MHSNGECLNAGKAICLFCAWYHALWVERAELSMDLSDDYHQAMQAARAWVARPGARGAISSHDLRGILRALRFKRLRADHAGLKKGSGQYFWAKLYHEGGSVYDGFGDSVPNAIADALEIYITLVSARQQTSTLDYQSGENQA